VLAAVGAPQALLSWRGIQPDLARFRERRRPHLLADYCISDAGEVEPGEMIRYE
jgi:hypothetical protein